jgi:inhibitor of KinA sporulation pathway (predicted exonuclease)
MDPDRHKVNKVNKVNYDYLICLDFEATAWWGTAEHEIIEFPSVVVDIAKKRIVDRLEQFVRPTRNPKVSKFCRKLTTITQAQVNSGISFKEALAKHMQFMAKYPNSILVTHSDWDLKTMLPSDCALNKVPLPEQYEQWIDIQKVVPCEKKGLSNMVKYFGLEFSGTPHRGIDDSRNIARICIEMLKRGWVPKPTTVMSS